MIYDVMLYSIFVPEQFCLESNRLYVFLWYGIFIGVFARGVEKGNLQWYAPKISVSHLAAHNSPATLTKLSQSVLRHTFRPSLDRCDKNWCKTECMMG
jgi:hypothetical protein